MNDFDGLVRALSNSSRRRILIALRDEEDIHPFAGDDEGNRSIRLRHVHLPLLADHGLVAWNEETGRVKRGADFDEVEPILTALEAQRSAFPDGSAPDGGQAC